MEVTAGSTHGGDAIAAEAMAPVIPAPAAAPAAAAAASSKVSSKLMEALNSPTKFFTRKQVAPAVPPAAEQVKAAPAGSISLFTSWPTWLTLGGSKKDPPPLPAAGNPPAPEAAAAVPAPVLNAPAASDTAAPAVAPAVAPAAAPVTSTSTSGGGAGLEAMWAMVKASVATLPFPSPKKAPTAPVTPGGNADAATT
jgi:DNA polymerase-3 subunit gamma/tau